MASFPDNSQIINNKFPYPEGYEWEYKRSYPVDNKLYETICAMLNHAGGHIVIGIQDDLSIIGIKIDKQLDRFLLSIDNIFHQKTIITSDLKFLDKSQITHSVKKLNNKDVLAIKIVRKEGESYQFRNGYRYDRLGASNLKKVVPMFYSDDTVTQMLNNLKKIHVEESVLLQAQFKKLEKEKEVILDKKESTLKQAKQSLDKVTELLFNKILNEKENAEKILKNKWCCI